MGGTYRIMIYDLKNHENSWGLNVRGPSVPGGQGSLQGTLGPQGHLDPGHLDPKTLGPPDFSWCLRS